ncbi:integrase (plasmid) [Burkholderia sp. PAMC 28687]|uniref:IS21 family transposase n=1 Tax=Burkholderia sp. PAMC 28687 TaxID=1795874 RepID=UPI000783ABC3|nr:IS21 family transposase [Burkholderia sp. PAMC 28687]AMM15324.1 integrase [Burkholderia sp. PAMC 28687]AMM18290.1 integrase [Burkholderia sp. PAMC 28687]AMM18784.1 integrase [Burkholderia sp. PAMC 28687]
MTMIGKVRRMFHRQDKSVREIARLTSLSRNTIRKYLKDEVPQEPKYERGVGATKLTPFHDGLIEALVVDAHRPRKERRRTWTLFEQIRAAGYEGCYSRVTDFIRAWRCAEGKSISTNAFVPLRYELGEAFQFDWSEEGLVIGGMYRKLQVAHTKLCASRAFWLTAYFSQGHEMLFDAHTRAFEALGGVARRGIYDNMKTAVDKVPRKGKGRLVNERFAVMCSHYLFEPDFCNVASGWEKGVVEKNVQDSRQRIWASAREERFASLAELNAWLDSRCRTLWGEVRHPDYKGVSVADVLDQEREHLMPMPAPFDGYVERLARVSSTCLVVIARNRYSVPCEFAGQMLSTRLYPTRIVVVAQNIVVAGHDRLAGEGQVQYDWQHYVTLLQRKPGALRNGAPFLDMPEPLKRLRVGLLREAGGDRVMAKVLALVPANGLDAVLAAVELALEQMPCSGRVSVEHVENVLARLRDAQLPPKIDTQLQLSTPPLANTSRYDGLRSTTSELDHA